jgi:hypothetical protein
MTKWIYHLRGDYRMAKDITGDFFSKNVYDFKNIDESGKLKQIVDEKLLGKKKPLQDEVSKFNTIMDKIKDALK